MSSGKDKVFYLAATALVIILTYLIDVYMQQIDTESLKETTNTQPDKSAQDQNLQAQFDDTLTKVQIQLSSVSLPPPSITVPLNKNNKDKMETSYTIKHAIDNVKNNTKTSDNSDITQSSRLKQIKTQAKIKQQLLAMTAMQGDSMQLRFPASQHETEQILTYMHDCIGIDLAAYKNDALIMLKQTHAQHSPMLRVASGHTNKTERSLLTLYANDASLARLYPLWFDMRLSAKIYEQVKDTKLSFFEGEYYLSGSRLFLKNIAINGIKLKESWLMADATMCGLRSGS